MPAADGPSVARDGEVLRIAGTLRRPQVAALWNQALPLARGATRLDASGIRAVDSAGVAMLAAVLAEAAAGARLVDAPPSLAELVSAYRLDPRSLGFGAA